MRLLRIHSTVSPHSLYNPIDPCISSLPGEPSSKVQASPGSLSKRVMPSESLGSFSSSRNRHPVPDPVAFLGLQSSDTLHRTDTPSDSSSTDNRPPLSDLVGLHRSSFPSSKSQASLEVFPKTDTPSDPSSTTNAPVFSSEAAPSSEPSFELVEFARDIPPYAILSHTWEDEEVTYQDMQYDITTARRKRGYAKLMGACRLALEDGYEYLWVDSCCINKESSADLSEALNSMYRYYGSSGMCYAYLSDVRHSEDPRAGDSTFRRCKWFTRGWTLQELIAPAKLAFYDKDWVEFGTKFSLHDAVSAITRIPKHVLFERDVSSISIAKRMSWAAFRETTRPEDWAYSLMGLFDVYMPPIYGEGLASAFLRLQREIINVSNDRSIFAWVADPDSDDLDNRGLLARSPFDFRFSGSISNVSDASFEGGVPSFSMTNSGTKIYLPLVQCGPILTKAYLHCYDEDSLQYLAIHLQHEHPHCYTRCNADELLLESAELPLDHVEEVYVSAIDLTNGPSAAISVRAIWDLEEIWSAPEMNSPNSDLGGVTSNSRLFDVPSIHQISTYEGTPSGGGRRKGQRDVSLNNENELVLQFRAIDVQGRQRRFAVALRRIVSDNSSTFLMEICTGQDVADFSIMTSPIVSPLSHPVYHASETLPTNERVSASLYRLPVSQKLFQAQGVPDWIIEIHLTSEQPVAPVPRTLSLPEFGFMVHTDCGVVGSDVALQLLDVHPADFFQINHGPRRSCISIDPNNPTNASRLLIYELTTTNNSDSTGFVPPVNIVVILGIQDSKAWSQTMFIEKQRYLEPVETDVLIRQSAHTRRWEDEVPYKLEFQPPLPSFDGFLWVTVGRKKKSMVAPASHRAHIHLVPADWSRVRKS
ncbi:hypothetical protein D9758_011545 [Tetrapyrgos nigripes]|uniref:Heterokaryon incompatibility domain-containing protein n=1 Tax=Tetrapyrgos nigripes TaxID=182062 RepID=A0A8H5FPK3_9AGAR|nr:hypothetical protein D9758_011545 [Tetrapyrgos nigripes]